MRKYRVSSAYGALLQWRNFRFKLFAESVLVGAVAGGVVVFFRYALENAEVLRNFLYQMAIKDASWISICGWIGLSLLIAGILHALVAWEPMASGSGIPQVKGVLGSVMRMPWLRVLVAKLAGGVTAIGAGLSLGREGPSIQLGAVVGQGISRLWGRSRMEERYLLTSGASAGLAAAFNAPLAGVVFSLEELHKNFSPAVLVSAITASLTATVLSQYFYGENPVFTFTGVPVFPVSSFGVLLVLGVGMGILGAAFNKGLLVTGSLFERLLPVSVFSKALLPLAFAGAFALLLPEVLGGGNGLVNELTVTNFGFLYLLSLLAAKFFFTLISYGSGVPGGIFLPMLVIGALGGSLFSYGFVQFGLLDSFYSANIIIFSMAACFAAVVKSPITGSILIMEMSGAFHHMLPLVFVSVIAYLTADLLRVQPIYEVLLEKALLKQGKRKAENVQSLRSIVEVLVCVNSKLAGKQVKQISWPSSCLLFSIRRGESEIVPKGETRIEAGDYLYVAVKNEQVESLQKMAEESIK